MDIPLTALRDGEQGIITSIQMGREHGSGQGRHGRGWRYDRRLMDMGLTPGTKIVVVRSAPFNGPLEVLVRGSRLALGRMMAHRIMVKKIER